MSSLTTTILPWPPGPVTRTNERVTVIEKSGNSSVERLSRRLLRSCILSSAICAATLALGVGEFTTSCQTSHAAFWFPMSLGSLGVAGSTFIRLKTLWRG